MSKKYPNALSREKLLEILEEIKVACRSVSCKHDAPDEKRPTYIVGRVTAMANRGLGVYDERPSEVRS